MAAGAAGGQGFLGNFRESGASPWTKTAFAGHSPRRFSTPLEMMAFYRRECGAVVGGKARPDSSFASVIPGEFLAICKASMVQSGIYPDFIVIDGNERRHRRRPPGIYGPSGHAMAEDLIFVITRLIAQCARSASASAAAGKIRDRVRYGARGWRSRADWCNSARGFKCFRWLQSSR